MNMNSELKNNPKVSIITVCYNEENGIEDTCRSVVSQDYKNYEWIVIDGGSTDKTLGILDRYKSNISVLISEKDSGVYDAMNKGILLARGEYLLFLNGGDYFFESDVLEKSFAENLYDADILYGNCCVLMEDGGKQILNFAENINKYYFLDVCINHQSTFIKRNLFERFGLYDQNYKILADYEKWLCFSYNKVDFRKLPLVVSNFKGFDGLSSNEKTKELSRKEREKSIKKYFRWQEVFFLRILKYIETSFLKVGLFIRSPRKIIIKYSHKLLNCHLRQSIRKIYCKFQGKKL